MPDSTVLRCAQRPAIVEARTVDGKPAMRMTVRYSLLNSWYPVRSWWEGDFIERVAPGSAEVPDLGQVRSLFNHGCDSAIGERALGVPERVYEEGGYACLDVALLSASYVEDIVEGVRAGCYGSSFMFTVKESTRVEDCEPSGHNPEGLPERTITRYSLMEAGPVTWPANAGADVSAGERSGRSMDWFYRRFGYARPGRPNAVASAARRREMEILT